MVVLHTAAWNWYIFPVDSRDWQVLNWIDSAVRFAVPIFFMISGALFLDPGRSVSLKSLLRIRIPRIAIAFAFWSVFYATVTTFGPGGTGSLRSLIGQIFVGHYHLWFLLALGGLYLATPLLRKITEDRDVAWYFVLLAFVFAAVLPLVAQIPLIGKLVGKQLETMQLDLVLGYSIYFVLGYLLSRLHLSAIWLAVVLSLGAVGVTVTAGGTSWLSGRAHEPISTLYGYVTPNVILVSIAVFLGIKAWSERPSGARFANWPVVSYLAKYSFGIFLVHPLFQWAYTGLGITTDFASPLISVPILAAMILLPSALLAALIQRIPVIGKYIA